MNETIQYNETTGDFQVLYNYGVTMNKERQFGCHFVGDPLRDEILGAAPAEQPAHAEWIYCQKCHGRMERVEPVAWANSDEIADAFRKGQSFNAWDVQHKGPESTVPLYASPAPADADYWHRIAETRHWLDQLEGK